MNKTLYGILVLQLGRCKTLTDMVRKRKVPAPDHSETENASGNRQSAQVEEKEEDAFCRICYSHENPLGLLNDLISPCGCKGTIKYVHRYCLRVWRFKGKQVKDIKICEQCFCEYSVDDEKQVGRAVVTVSTVAVMISLLILTSMFITSTADTARFILNDIYTYMHGNSRMISFDRPIIICNMDSVVAMKNNQNPLRTSFVLQKIESSADPNIDHFASIKKKYIYNLKNIHLLDIEKGDSFMSVAIMSMIYTIACEDNPVLFINFALSFWRIIAFDTFFDWFLYGMICLYIYSQMFEKIYKLIDNYCMYVINVC
ncbi:uncharacterized protein NESG_00227 [Nematocida ausubeli]|uniref:RING-CH-type domain-containing protein n=1 Tax=Nematocida ausubeli (strain ATCC PRA-371 / ERTm2) TaxID=1913371 RepID=A0A086J4T3_NEMA1|nr:uncharacterized protein NESG_00227 [Nematocida ausubeli]KFG27151.1 hypothetical protein NESG_00227 [Nematocida ausubeli]